eukprot:1487285-Amphidinium_carterae.2
MHCRRRRHRQGSFGLTPSKRLLHQLEVEDASVRETWPSVVRLPLTSSLMLSYQSGGIILSRFTWCLFFWLALDPAVLELGSSSISACVEIANIV